MSDYVSREAAIKAAEHAYGEWNLAMAAADGSRQINLVYKRQELLKAVASVFDIVPAADVEPVRRWIPCSERPPEEDDTYLCVYRFPSSQKSRCTTMFFYATDPNPHFQYENYHGIKITHWLPTPPLPNQEIGEK